jgi:hypothetical protein
MSIGAIWQSVNTGAQILADIQDEIEPAVEAVACIRHAHQ